MVIFSNYYFFPILQIALLVLLSWAVFRDFRIKSPVARGGDSVTATVTRGEESMKVFEKVTGLVLAAVVTFINKAIFDENETWRHYSGFFNVADVCAILYLCYFSTWGRNHIISWYIRSKTD